MEYKIWNRKTNSLLVRTEKHDKILCFLYETAFGRILLKYIVAQPFFSRVAACWYDSRFSKKKIAGFVEKNGVDLSACKKKNFESFNDFFSRQEIRTSSGNFEELTACADGSLIVYEVSDDLKMRIKGSNYSIDELISDSGAGKVHRFMDDNVAGMFAGGICLVFRLSLSDYHRFYFSDDGEILDSLRIQGKLHTVRPIAGTQKVFIRNTRDVTLMKTNNLGLSVQVEVGAMLVGKIVNYKHEGVFGRMEEKGYFAYGGSTVIQLYQKNAVSIDKDIIQRSADCIETMVRAGEEIGSIKRI